jgi:hypothetical protein
MNIWGITPQSRSSGCDPFDASQAEGDLAAYLNGLGDKIQPSGAMREKRKPVVQTDKGLVEVTLEEKMDQLRDAMERRAKQSEAALRRIDLNRSALKKYSVRKIMEVCGTIHDVSYTELVGHSRKGHLVRARQHAAWLSAMLIPGLSLSLIAKLFKRDHTTILHSVTSWPLLKDKEAKQAADLAVYALGYTEKEIQDGIAARAELAKPYIGNRSAGKFKAKIAP